MQILKEFKKREIPRDEFYLAIYTRVIKDEQMMKEYEAKYAFEKPIELLNEERRRTQDIDQKDIEDWEKRKAKLKLQIDLRKKYRLYFRDVDTLKFRNESNKTFLLEMRAYLNDKAPTLILRIDEALDTHEAKR